MKFFICALKTEFKIFLADKKFLLLLCLIPLCCYIVSIFIPAEEALPVLPVGISIPEGSERGEELFQQLNREIGVVEFIKADPETLRRNVASGNWECGFILIDDFDKDVNRGKYSDIFTLVINEGSTLHSLVSEALSSAMLTIVAPDIGSRYLKKEGIEEPEGGYALESEFQLEVIPISDTEIHPSTVATAVTQTAINGFAAVVMMVISISLGDKIAGRKMQSYHSRISAIVGDVAVIAPSLLAEFVLLSVVSSLTLMALGADFGAEILVFCFCLTTLSFLVSALPHGSTAVFLPFLPPFLLVLSPVFFDVTSFYPQLKILVSTIPVTHFLNITKGVTIAYWGLVFLSAVFISLAMILYRLQKKKP